jgi:hypothetical protein
MRSHRSSLALALFVAVVVLLAGGAAEARHVFLNGVKLDDNVAVKAQTFAGCEVRIDESGDIHITAKGYKVFSSVPGGSPPPPQPPAPAPAAPPPVTPPPPPPPPIAKPAVPRPTWLISKESFHGATQYDIDVYINEAFVKKVRSVDDPIVLDVSRWVQNGENRVRMIAVKQLGERRVSTSAADTLEVILGQGNASGGMVTVDKVLVTFRRNANEVQNIREDFSFKYP